ncbi:hypothetical protein GQ607_007426, partial [Colletotrichum asianum]
LDPHHIIFSGGEMLHKSAYMLRTYTTNEPGHGQSHHAATVLPTYSTTTTWRIMVCPTPFSLPVKKKTGPSSTALEPFGSERVATDLPVIADDGTMSPTRPRPPLALWLPVPRSLHNPEIAS